MRKADNDEAERLLGIMDDVYGLLVTIDYPDALTGGLRRTTDALRAVIERTRGDVTNALVIARLQAAISYAVRSLGNQPLGGSLHRSRGGVAQPGRALRSQRRSRGFKSHHLHTVMCRDIGDGCVRSS